MEQIHKRFTVEQVKAMLSGYTQGLLDRAAIQEILGINKTRFFALLKQYQGDPVGVSLSYHRASWSRISASVEKEMQKELLKVKSLIDDPSLPISTYNYSAVRDRLIERGATVALSTVIERAKRLGCYQPHPKKKAHDREVVTTAIGALIQHDASHHRWSPFAKERWTLITSLDDFSRKLLYAELFEEETTWAHIKAAQALTHDYGIPPRYYVDSSRVFRFVQSRDSVWRKHVLQTDDANPSGNR